MSSTVLPIRPWRIARIMVAATIVGNASLPAEAQTPRQASAETPAAADIGADVLRDIAKAESENAAGSKELARALEPVLRKLDKDGRWAEATELALRILALEESAYGSDNVDEVSGTLLWIGELYGKVGRFADAVEFTQRALSIRQRGLAPESGEIYEALDQLGLLLSKQGSYSEAIAIQLRNKDYWKRSGKLDRQISSLYYIAITYTQKYSFLQARAVLEELIPIAEVYFGKESILFADQLRAIGRFYGLMSEYSAEENLLQRARGIIERNTAPESLKRATILDALGQQAEELGNDDQALTYRMRALTIYERNYGPESIDLLPAINAIAANRAKKGEFSQSLRLFERALEIVERNQQWNHVAIAALLDYMGTIYVQLRNYDKALPLLERSVMLTERSFGLSHELNAARLISLAKYYRAKGEGDKAHPLLQRALAILELQLGRANVQVALILIELATTDAEAGLTQQAIQNVQQAIVVLEEAPGGTDSLWNAQARLAQMHWLLRQPELAIFWAKQSVNNLQRLRSSLKSMEDSLQASFIKNRTLPYTQLADWLINEGRIGEAQQVLLMLKERELYDEVLRGTGAPPQAMQVDLNGVERSKFTEYYRIRDSQVALANERRQLEAKPEAERTAADKKRLEVITGDLFPRVKDAMDAFLASLQRDLAQVDGKSGDPTVNLQMRQVELRKSVEKLAGPRGEPAARAVALQYVMTDKRLSIILTVPGGPPVARQTNVSYAELAQRINQFTLALQSSGSPMEGDNGVRAQARALHRILIEPVLADLKKADARTLMLSLTDVLRFMPFAALHDGEHYLIENFALSLYNEAATSLENAAHPRWRIAGFGLSEAADGLPALSAVPIELAAVTSRSPGGARWLNMENPSFNRSQLRDAIRSGNFDVLHLATHFVVRLGDTAGSRLYLGDKSTLSLAQLTGEDMRFDGIDLVTLSACQTAVGGGKTSYGQEMESLSALVQTQGASAVIATLWKVADKSTGALMARFYENKAKGSVNKADAMRQAQIALISGEVTVPGSKQLNWKHPFYWAPFVLMGNWR